MDPVDVLTVAVHAAQLIRSQADPEVALAGAYEALGLERPEDADEALAVRIARLADAAETRRDRLIAFLGENAGPLPLNRPERGWGGAVEPAVVDDDDEGDAGSEIEELVDYAESEEDSAREMMGDLPAFSVAERRIDHYFGGRTVVVRDGQRLSEDEAGELREGDSVELEEEDLPRVVRGLIDYPLDRPCLFTIEVGESPWSVWDICCAFAEQYARIYEEPEKYGVWGHDLTDLWIESLLFFPDKGLIYPHMGS